MVVDEITRLDFEIEAVAQGIHYHEQRLEDVLTIMEEEEIKAEIIQLQHSLHDLEKKRDLL